jgi:hypothetical protein
MLYMAKTAHVQADARIDCTGIAEIDASIKPWALLVLAEDSAVGESGWRLVGAYATERAALAARRRLSRFLRCADYDAMPSRSLATQQLPPRDAGHLRVPAARHLAASS